MNRNVEATPDADRRSVVDLLPHSLRPYARLARFDRPIGIWLLYWPCAWGLLLPAGVDGRLINLLLFFIGATAMRAAGCVYNDIVDRDLDASVARTASRPLASGQVSLTAAWCLLILLSLVGLAVLLTLPGLAQIVALLSLLLVAAYPFMKRITWWPQAWLGLTFNWGALVGYAAAADVLDAPAYLLYAAGILWTLGYDTIYALQDIEDDALIGIKSSARRLAGHVKTGVALFYLGSALFAAAALAAAHGFIWALAALPFALHLAWQVARLSDARALPLFKSNALAGLLLAAGVAIAAVSA